MVFTVLLSLSSFAQKGGEVIVVKDVSGDTVINFIKYRKYITQWTNVGIHYTQSIAGIDAGFIIDHQHKIKRSEKLYGQFGGEYAKSYKDTFFTKYYDRVYYELHYGVGTAKVEPKFIYAYFGGISAMIGSKDLNRGMDNSINSIGVYISAQAIYRIVYDMGIGVGAVATLNNRYSFIGIKIFGCFTNGYLGNVRGKKRK